MSDAPETYVRALPTIQIVACKLEECGFQPHEIANALLSVAIEIGKVFHGKEQTAHVLRGLADRVQGESEVENASFH